MEQDPTTMGFVPFTLDLDSYKKIGGTGVLGLEFASGYWNMSSFPDDCLILLASDSEKRLNSIITYVGIPVKESYDHTIKLSKDLFITDRERTICDMIEYGCELRFLLESIQSYYEDFDDKSKLEDLVKERGLLDKFNKYKEEAEDMYYDDI